MNDSIQFTSINEYRDYLRKIAKTNPKVKAAYELLWEHDEENDSINLVMADEGLSENEFVESILSNEDASKVVCLNENQKKANEKIAILEDKLKSVGTYALDAICLLDVV